MAWIEFCNELAWVAWVHKILAWVTLVTSVKTLAWVACVNKLFKKNDVGQKSGMGLNVLLFNQTL